MTSGASVAAPLDLPARPAFGRHLSVHVAEGDGVALLSERGAVVLAGAVYEQLAPLLDGTRTSDEIVDLLETRHDAAEVYYAIALLAADGHVVDAAARAGDDADAFWELLGAGRGRRRALADTPIAITGDVRDVSAWSAALRAHDFAVTDDADVVLRLARDYLEQSLATWNRRARADGRSWLLVRTGGTRAWIGPYFQPTTGPCWECLRDRLARNDAVGDFLRRRHGRAPALPPTAAAWTSAVVQGLVAGQLARVLLGEPEPTADARLTIVDTVTLGSREHVVTRRPQCAVCGDPSLYARQVEAPFTLARAPKQFTADGGHRTVSPAETVARFGHLVDPVTGVVTALTRSTAADSALHVYTAGANPVFRYHDLTGLRAGLRRASGGKGFSDAQARASALAEALERHSASAHGDEPVLRSSLRALEPRGAIDPRRVMLYSDAQYATRSARAVSASVHDRVPEPMTPDTPLDWSPLWSLSEGRVRYLPTSLLYMGHRDGAGAAHCHGDSNGCAAGNTREEAVLQGLFELVERDACALWWYNRLPRPGVHADEFDGPEWDATRAYYRERAREFWLLDITTDLAIPTFVAVSRAADRSPEQILVGLGTHLDPRVAASRAVSEMNQMCSALDAMARGGGVNAGLTEWLRDATIASEPHLAPSPAPPRRVRDFHDVSGADLRDDIDRCQRTVESLGMELLVCDQTRADVGLPVVKVVVPGLRHFRPRFAPGRLYDVPAALGWTARPTPEARLNPIPFFL